MYNEVFHGKYNLLSEQEKADFLATQGVDERKFKTLTNRTT